MEKYIYEGPVMRFDTCIASKWVGETVAHSEAKARCNLAYKFKKENNLEPNTSIRFTGVLRKEHIN